MKVFSGNFIDSPAFPLMQSLISYQGTTSADGSALGITLVDDGLALEPSYDGALLKILSGPAAGQFRTIAVHAGNTTTVGAAFTNVAGAVQQITAGVRFVILSISGGGGSGPSPEEGLVYHGVVDAVPGANQFTLGSLAGLGAGKFAGATNPYYAFVLRDAGGASAAPQGEILAVTAYTTATGVFATAAFTAPVAVGDEILIIHPSLAGVFALIADLAVPAADAVANLLERDVIGNKTDTAVETKSAVNSIIAYLKGVLDILTGADGVTAFPASSPPANGVSLAEVIRYINDLVVAAFTLAETGGTLTADGTEQNVVIENAPASVFIPTTVMIDLTDMAGGDNTIIRTYYRITAAGGLLLSDEVTYNGAISPPLITIDLKPNRFGFKVTLEQTAGVNRDYDWEYLYES